MPAIRRHRDDIEIVGLERNRKREDVELAQRARLLERYDALVALAHVDALVGIGKEGALGSDQRIGFEDVEDGLEAEIRHREAVDVGVNDADGNIAARDGAHRAPSRRRGDRARAYERT